MIEPPQPPNVPRLFDGIFALIVASVAGSTLLAFTEGDSRSFPILFIGALLLGAIFGLPAYGLARHCRWDKPWTAAVTGLLIAVAPTSCGVMIDSSPREHMQVPWGGLAGTGLAGILAGVVFLALMKWPSPRAVKSRWFRTGLNGLAAIAAFGATYLIPYPSIDRSCHNPLRDGRKSLGAAASFDLHVGMDQWGAIAEEMKSFGAAGHWSALSDVRPDPGFPWLQISLCQAPGTVIQADRGFGEVVSFSAFQPQGGSSWQPAFGQLYRRLDARWPGKISFSDSMGNPIATPNWARGAQPSGAYQAPTSLGR